MMTLVRCAALAAMLAPASAAGQDFDAGLRAADAGDYATALHEWQPLAEQGDTRAQSVLGFLYDQGLGVAQDYAEAARWYRAAAEQGDALAQERLGFMYFFGLGVAQDYAETVRWYRAVAEQGIAEAQALLGLLYREGQGVAQDYMTAHMWLNIAAAHGNEEARENRDIVADRMTADAIAEAQQRARVCMESNYQDCD